MAAKRTIRQRLKDRVIRASRALKDSVTVEDLKPYKSSIPRPRLRVKKKIRKPGTNPNPFHLGSVIKTVRQRNKKLEQLGR